MKEIYVVVKHNQTDGVQLSHGFSLMSNAQIYASCYGGSVRCLQLAEDTESKTLEQFGMID